MMQTQDFNEFGSRYLPGYLGIVVTKAKDTELTAQMEVKKHLMAPNEFLHAGAVVTLADSCAGYCCAVNLPQGAKGFTTIELKSNFLGTAREGIIECTASLTHSGRKTQVWDAVVKHVETGKTIALFRCTQMILY